MTLDVFYTKQFARDTKKMQKRNKDMSKLKVLISLLLEEKHIPRAYKNHKLIGDYKDYWECHIEPDWLLIYKKNATQLIFQRTGSHSDLF